MNKKELQSAVADKTSGTASDPLTKLETDACVNATLDAITEALAKGEEVNIPGFGKFTVSQRDARMGKNPATGEDITIPAQNVVRFKPSRTMKEAVNSDSG